MNTPARRQVFKVSGFQYFEVSKVQDFLGAGIITALLDTESDDYAVALLFARFRSTDLT